MPAHTPQRQNYQEFHLIKRIKQHITHFRRKEKQEVMLL